MFVIIWVQQFIKILANHTPTQIKQFVTTAGQTHNIKIEDSQPNKEIRVIKCANSETGKTSKIIEINSFYNKFSFFVIFLRDFQRIESVHQYTIN